MQRSGTGLIVSLKYAPWHYAFMAGFARRFRSTSPQDIRLLLSNTYRWMLSEDLIDESHFVGTSDSSLSMLLDCANFLLFRWITIFRLLLKDKPSFIYFVNPHPLNPMIGLLAKVVVGDCKVLTHVHEPEANQAARRLDLRIYETLIQLIQTCAIRCSDDIVVSSARARTAVQSKYASRIENIHLVPLLIEDFAISQAGDRRYVTYLGSARRQRGIDKFLRFAEYCFENSVDLEFQIVTKDNISEFLREIDPRVCERLTIINKAYIGNEEIADALSQSLACCVLYTSEMMQSGVVPVALMSGTPLIVTPFRGLTEFVTDSENAIVLSSSMSNEEILRAVKRIHANFPAMSKNARETFDNTFHEKNWTKYFPRLISMSKLSDGPMASAPIS